MEKERNYPKVAQIINCSLQEHGVRMYNTTQPLPFFIHSGEPQYEDYGIIILIIWKRTIIIPPSTFIEHPVLCQLFSV